MGGQDADLHCVVCEDVCIRADCGYQSITIYHDPPPLSLPPSSFSLVKFAVMNPSLSLGEVYKDLNKKAFMREAQKLVPSVTLDMVEESFAGVMAQVRLWYKFAHNCRMFSV